VCGGIAIRSDGSRSRASPSRSRSTGGNESGGRRPGVADRRMRRLVELDRRLSGARAYRAARRDALRHRVALRRRLSRSRALESDRRSEFHSRRAAHSAHASGVRYEVRIRWDGTACIAAGDHVFDAAARLRRDASAYRRAAAAPSSSSTPAPASPPPRWHWPTSGQVVSRFGSSEGGLSTGIAIAGREGQAIEAAADGRVVYAGTGLIGYGQLLIIRHNDTYLTAYGYNRRLLVEQGDEVKRGQKIAEMGLNPARQPRLHFEVRRNGVPVDPLTLMSPR